MANRAKVLRLADGDRERLGRLAASATVSAREHVRSKVLLLKADGRTDAEVADKMDVDPSTVRRCVARYEAGGLEAALADAPGRGRKQEISESDRLWAVSLACTRPKDVGRSAEFWYPASFARYVNEVAEAQGHPRMATVSESTLRRIMDEGVLRNEAAERMKTRYADRDKNLKMSLLRRKLKTLRLRIASSEWLKVYSDDYARHMLATAIYRGIKRLFKKEEVVLY